MYTQVWKFQSRQGNYIGGFGFSAKQNITHYAEVPIDVKSWEFSINYNGVDTIVGLRQNGEQFEVSIKQWK